MHHARRWCARTPPPQDTPLLARTSPALRVCTRSGALAQTMPMIHVSFGVPRGYHISVWIYIGCSQCCLQAISTGWGVDEARRFILARPALPDTVREAQLHAASAHGMAANTITAMRLSKQQTHLCDHCKLVSDPTDACGEADLALAAAGLEASALSPAAACASVLPTAAPPIKYEKRAEAFLKEPKRIAISGTAAAATSEESVHVTSLTAQADDTLAQRTRAAAYGAEQAGESVQALAPAMGQWPDSVWVPPAGAAEPVQVPKDEALQPRQVPACLRPCLLPAMVNRTPSALPLLHLPSMPQTGLHAQHPVSMPSSAVSAAQYCCRPQDAKLMPSQQAGSEEDIADGPELAAHSSPAIPEISTRTVPAGSNMTLDDMQAGKQEGNSLPMNVAASTQAGQAAAGQQPRGANASLDGQAAKSVDKPEHAGGLPVQCTPCNAEARGEMPPGACLLGANQAPGVMQAQKPAEQGQAH